MPQALVTVLSSRPAEDAEREARETFGLHELVVSMSQLARPLSGVSYRDADTHRGLDLLLDGLRVPAAVGPVCEQLNVTAETGSAQRLLANWSAIPRERP